jgi:dCTP diphosphatase
MTLEDLLNRVRKFNEARSWRRFHDPRSLILALCGEIGELAQIFRWRRRAGRVLSASKRAEVEGEVADILIYLLSLCIELDIDPAAVVRAKLEENEKRFPLSGVVQEN